MFNCPPRRSGKPVRGVPWSRQSIQRVAGGPGGNTHIAADLRDQIDVGSVPMMDPDLGDRRARRPGCRTRPGHDDAGALPVAAGSVLNCSERGSAVVHKPHPASITEILNRLPSQKPRLVYRPSPVTSGTETGPVGPHRPHEKGPPRHCLAPPNPELAARNWDPGKHPWLSSCFPEGSVRARFAGSCGETGRSPAWAWHDCSEASWESRSWQI